MFAHFARTSVAFGVVFVVYQLYALAVVPLLEPPLVRRQTAAPDDLSSARSAVRRYQELLANYFPSGHWSLVGKPRVIESGPIMLVLSDYERDDRGRVDLKNCAVVLFPTPRQDGGRPPRDAIVMEAPRGARLQFDQDFNPSRGRIGRVVAGEFPGPITIRSDMREAGPEDDLLIQTRDVRMSGPLVFTPHEVEIRWGPHQGSGKRLEIKLLQEEHSQSFGGGLKIAGVETLEVFEQVRLEMRVGTINALGEPSNRQARNMTLQRRPVAFPPTDPLAQEAAAWGDLERTPHSGPRPVSFETPPGSPLIVTCQGSFEMDMVRLVATFIDRVYATQLNLDGQSDQLVCEQLDLHFAPGDEGSPDSIAHAPDRSDRQRNSLDEMRPRWLEAKGDPVKVDSPTRQAYARGQHLRLDLDRRRLTLDGGDPALVQGPNQVRAPVISYEHPTPEEPAAIGRLWMAGPGSLRVVPKLERPEEVIEARWSAVEGIDFPMQLTRVHGEPVLLVEGRPQVAASTIGRITADRIRVAMREVPADGKQGPAIELGRSNQDKPLGILAERIDATGSIELKSPELSGRTHELVVLLNSDRPQGGEPDNPSQRPRTRFGSGEKSHRNAKSYAIVAEKMQLGVKMQQGRADPTTLHCRGRVRFREVIDDASQEEALVVSGDQLKVDNLSADSVQVLVQGGEGSEPTSSLATIDARGLSLRAARVHLDQGANRMWAKGAGDARVRVDRDFLGQSSGAPTDWHLRWRGGLEFDGRRILVREDVFGEGPHDWLRCAEAIATLSQPVRFGRSNGTDEIQIETLECRGGVTLDHRSVDPQGQRSHERAELKTLRIHQKSGALAGDGPGWIRSVHLNNGSEGLTALGRPARQADDSPIEDVGERLRFLRVHFRQKMDGDLKNRIVAFHGRVRAVTGPVLAWEQELPLEFTSGPPPNTALLESDHLQVNEDPVARTRAAPSTIAGSEAGPLELRAWGNVRLEGAAKGEGLFSAQAATASYQQRHERFTLEGNSRQQAILWRQAEPGAHPTTSVAGKVIYWRKEQRVKMEGFSELDHAPSPLLERGRTASPRTVPLPPRR